MWATASSPTTQLLLLLPRRSTGGCHGGLLLEAPPRSRRPLFNKSKVCFTIKSKQQQRHVPPTTTTTTTTTLLPNAQRRKRDPSWVSGFSLGVDLGDSRTGLALGKGFHTPRPLSVLELKGQKLELRLMDIAQKEEADEFIVGLPRSRDGKETPQSNKVRSVVGRLAVRAAERGWRVYLQDENGTSMEALDYMIDTGVRKHARQKSIDAYSAMMVLERYFSTFGNVAELVLPKQLDLQERLQRGPDPDEDFFPQGGLWS